jgi:hypothetical protein
MEDATVREDRFRDSSALEPPDDPQRSAARTSCAEGPAAIGSPQAIQPMELFVILIAAIVALGSARLVFRSSEPMIVRLFSLVVLVIGLWVIWFMVNNQGHAMEAFKRWLEPLLWH